MRKGFTLLEVMVALVILAAALLAVSEIVSGALRNHERARDLDVATLLARGKMVDLEEQYRTEGFRDTDETDEGTFEEEGHPEFRWTAEVIAPAIAEAAELGSISTLAPLAPSLARSPASADGSAMSARSESSDRTAFDSLRAST